MRKIFLVLLIFIFLNNQLGVSQEIFWQPLPELTTYKIERLFVGPGNTLYASYGRLSLFQEEIQLWKEIFNNTAWDVAFLDSLLFVASGYIFRTNDGGNSWDTFKISPSTANCFALNSKGHIFVGTRLETDTGVELGGVNVTRDSGNTWQSTQLRYGYNTHDILINSSDEIYVGTMNKGIYLSVDDGNTFDSFNDGLTTQTIMKLSLNSRM